ncbi:MAG TPA: gephyrin-like molybdotransferase Glp [bacterium]|nr:gephyrin-like molybdotransferase Glp [bacterium]
MKKEIRGQEKLMRYEDALSRVLGSVTRKLAVESVAVEQSLGRVLREDVRAGFNIPPFDKSAMDGYAVRARDTRGAAEDAPVTLRVIEDLPAGKSPRRKITAGHAARIMTGAPRPAGADAVVMVEQTERDDAAGAVRIFREVKPGENAGQAGEDVKKGALVLRSGSRIGPADMGMMAALGRARVKVSARPRVAVISTGDEVQVPGKKLGKGQIYDANGYSLTGLAALLHCDAKFLGIARDRAGELKKKIRAARGADVVALTGGVSMGDYDFVTGLLRSLTARQIFYKANIKPGKPTFAGIKGKQLFFGLPGNPVSCMVCFELFVRPALEKMAGRSAIGMPRGRAVLDVDLKLKPGRRKFIRAAVVGSGPELRVRPYFNQKSGVLSSMVESDVLLDIPGDSSSLAAGTQVELWWLWEDRAWRS